MSLVEEKVAVGSIESRTFPGDRSAPRAATAWLRSLPLPLSESRFADAELCLDELVTNVILYAWTEGGGRSLTVRVARTESHITITVEDDGRPFDPSKVRIPVMPESLDETYPGGRGLMLVRSTAPEVRYERRDGRNRTTVAFPVEG